MKPTIIDISGIGPAAAATLAGYLLLVRAPGRVNLMGRPAPRHLRATFPETTLPYTRYEQLGVESYRIDEPDS